MRLVTTRKCGRNAFGRVCPSVCLCVCPVRTFERLDIESLFWYSGVSSEYLGQGHTWRSSGQGQGHRRKNAIQAYVYYASNCTNEMWCVIRSCLFMKSTSEHELKNISAGKLLHSRMWCSFLGDKNQHRHLNKNEDKIWHDKLIWKQLTS